MPDTREVSDELLIDNLFIDGDTRRITLKNPKDEITAQEIAALETMILNGGQSTLLIGDKTSSPFRRINKITKRNIQTIKFDLT